MRYSVTILLITLVLASCSKGKLEFSKVEKLESATQNRLNKVHFKDGIGYITGGEIFLEANILVSNDNGNSWTWGSYPESGKGMYGLSSTPSGRVVSVGLDGKLLYSDDKGATWQFVQLNPWLHYKDVSFKSNNSGIVIGGNSFNSGYMVFIDQDGRTSNFDSFAIQLNRIHLIDNNLGFIVGFGVVMKTINGGRDWDILDIKNDNFSGIHVLNNNEIWVCGTAGSIYKTSNSGASWDKLRNGNNITLPKYALQDILFLDATHGWAVGEDGLVIRTEDGGKSWDKYKSFTDNTLRDIEKTPDGNLIVVGDKGTIFKLYPTY